MHNELIVQDLYRATATGNKVSFRCHFRKDASFRLIYYFRKAQEYQNKNKIVWNYYRYRLTRLRNRLGIEIPLSVSIGGGLQFIHPRNITLNGKVKAGKNLTMLKGCTIGHTLGPKGGCPVLGDNVYVGLNAVVVGNIRIGNDVMICANAFVNFDVPDHSVVIGNPGVIHKKEKATQYYIRNAVFLQ